MVQINWTDQAKQDLKSISDYISIDSVKYAKLQIVRLRSKTKILKNHLRAGRMVPEYEDESIRELIEGRYRTVSRLVSDSRIDILTVHHSSKDFSNFQV